MNRIIIFIILVSIFEISCENNHEQNEIIELVDDSKHLDSLRKKHHKFLKNFEIESQLKPKNGTISFRVFREIDIKALDNDTLKYFTDYSRWNIPDSTIISDQKFWFQDEIAISDIDTSNIKYEIKDDIIWISVFSIDTLKAKWSKFDLKTNRMMWQVPSNSIRFAYFTSKSKIKKSFKYYKMYNPTSKNQMDYVTLEIDTISGLQLFYSIKKNIIDYCRKSKS